MDVRLRLPFTAVVAGLTGSGKTTLLKRLIELRHHVSNPSLVEVIYCYDAWQKAFLGMKDMRFHSGMIDLNNEIHDNGGNRRLIVDELMEELTGK